MRRSCLYSAVLVCMLALGVTAVAATSLLWAEYSPQYKVWIPFAAIGIAAALALASCSGAPATKQAASHAASAKTITEPANAGTLARMRIISSEQYLNTVAYIFGKKRAKDAE